MVKFISWPRVTEETCNMCRGRGVIPTPDGRKWQLCPRCLGRGTVTEYLGEYRHYALAHTGERLNFLSRGGN